MKKGGKIIISANLKREEEKTFLSLRVFDSGRGVGKNELSESRRKGVGLNNIEQRLTSYYGKKARLNIESKAGKGTTAEIRLVVNSQELSAENR